MSLNVVKYSGHGGQTRDLDGDEIDGRDEGKGLMSKSRNRHPDSRFSWVSSMLVTQELSLISPTYILPMGD